MSVQVRQLLITTAIAIQSQMQSKARHRFFNSPSSSHLGYKRHRGMPGRHTSCTAGQRRAPEIISFRESKVLGPGNWSGEHEEGGLSPQIFFAP